MGRRPKQFHRDIDGDLELSGALRIWSEEYDAFLTAPHIPVDAVRGTIRALLQHVSIPGLNREVAEADMLTALLHKNRIVHQAATQSRETQGWLKRLLERSGTFLVKRVLDDSSRHSVSRMRAESDEVLQSLTNVPFRKTLAQRRRWIDANLPAILSSLKKKQKCFTGCPGLTKWPPSPSDDRTLTQTPEEENSPAAMKNAILAYFHGIKVHTVRHYLKGRKLKTASRSITRRS